jgi:hypothetical protein
MTENISFINSCYVLFLHLIDQKDAVESYPVFTDLVQGNSFLSRIEKVCDETRKFT